MTNELIDANVLLPTVQHVQLSATSSDEMQLSQQAMVNWFSGRLAQARAELELAERNLKAAEAAGNFNLTPFGSAIRRMKNEVIFYEKCCLASEQGHALVPNFPVDVFAIRTNAKRPTAGETTSAWRDHEQKAKKLPFGEGRYVDSLPFVRQRRKKEFNERTQKEETHWVYWANAFQDSIDYPESVRHPQVITAIGQAMDMKVFDDFGVLPSRRRKGDPIVVGRIHKHGAHADPLCFLIAWYIDTRTL